MENPFLKLLIKLLPTKLLSAINGVLFSLKLPRPFASLSIRLYAAVVGANFTELDRDISEFSSIQDFFTRFLKNGARPIRGAIVHPVDGILREAHVVNEDTETSVKGIAFSLPSVLASKELASKFTGGFITNYYLSPKDYHRVHSPVSFKLNRIRQIPGRLLPVNNLFMNLMPTLFEENARAVLDGVGEDGASVCVVLIGAFNVGSIQISVSENSNIKVGYEIGYFSLGSSVLVILSKDYEIPGNLIGMSEKAVKMGEAY